jgi:hypothetical protein
MSTGWQVKQMIPRRPDLATVALKATTMVVLSSSELVILKSRGFLFCNIGQYRKQGIGAGMKKAGGTDCLRLSCGSTGVPTVAGKQPDQRRGRAPSETRFRRSATAAPT